METATKEKTITVALVGNPNVGKSVVFNYLTGVYVDVSNYPGTTIQVSKAKLKESEIEIIDTPGVYGISSFNDEEKATRDYVLDADLIVNVVSSTTLSRDLFLTKQLVDMGKPMILVLNQIDEAKLRKVDIKLEVLQEELGIEVIEAIAISSLGMDKLVRAIKFPESKFKAGKISEKIDSFILPYIEDVLTRQEALMIAEGDETIADRNNIELNSDFKEKREEIYSIRRKEVDELVSEAVSHSAFSKRAMFGQLLIHPVIGAIAAALVLYFFLFQFLGVYVAGEVVDALESNVFNAYYEPFVRDIVSKVFPIIADNMENLLIKNPMAAIGTLLAGDYGVLTLTITYLYGLLMPLVLGFYFGLAILEDSGYLPRLAVLCDGFLSRLGMNGRAIIPLILGGGCVTMAVVTTRLLSNEKEKFITMALLGLSIPCSAQLGVIQGLLANIEGNSVMPWLVWGGTLFLIFAAVGTVMNKMISGDCGHFVSDIPPMRLPGFKNVMKKTFVRSKVFLDEATPAFFIAAAVVAFLQIAGVLDNVVAFFEPIIYNLLLLPKEVSLSFILGMVRRDFGAFGLLDIPMSAAQLVTACLVLTLFVPCIATVAVMIKEKSWGAAMSIWLISWVLAFGFGAVFARIVGYLL